MVKNCSCTVKIYFFLKVFIGKVQIYGDKMTYGWTRYKYNIDKCFVEYVLVGIYVCGVITDNDIITELLTEMSYTAQNIRSCRFP